MKTLHYWLSVTSDAFAFLGALLMAIAIFKMNSKDLHVPVSQPDAQKELTELVDALEFHRTLTIIAITFLTIGFAIRLVVLRIVKNVKHHIEP